MQSLLVISHLRWDFVFQRPQHLMTRLAARYRVHFVEEPVYDPQDPHWEITHPHGNVTVYRPHSPCAAPGFHEEQTDILRALLRELPVEQGTDLIVWLYTPMALPLIAEIEHALLIFDCMDELSAFYGAPAQLLERERQLLATADLVFTGGLSLFATKRADNPRVHCFPSSVDRHHFGPGSDPRNGTEAQSRWPHPRLGFFGVLDERLDIALLQRVADAHPEWTLVMVGPVVKIDPAALPQRPNIHYVGPLPYAALPKYLAGWDVCLLPFALNESTRSISPTKTLEYMAAGKPIVSTPIPDVVAQFGHLVSIGAGAEFVRLCEAALGERPAAAQRRRALMDAAVSATSWDRTVREMQSLMDQSQDDPAQGQSGRSSSLRSPLAHADSAARVPTE